MKSKSKETPNRQSGTRFTLVKADSNSYDNVYDVAIMAMQCHCEISPNSFDQYSTSARRLREQ